MLRCGEAKQKDGGVSSHNCLFSCSSLNLSEVVLTKTFTNSPRNACPLGGDGLIVSQVPDEVL